MDSHVGSWGLQMGFSFVKGIKALSGTPHLVLATRRVRSRLTPRDSPRRFISVLPHMNSLPGRCNIQGRKFETENKS